MGPLTLWDSVYSEVVTFCDKHPLYPRFEAGIVDCPLQNVPHRLKPRRDELHDLGPHRLVLAHETAMRSFEGTKKYPP